MASVTASFEGDLVAQLDALDAGIRENVLRSAAHAGAVVFYNEARQLAPVYGGPLQGKKPPKPGQLRDSIYRVFSVDGSTDLLKLYEISWNHRKAPHGYWMENGYWLTRGKRKGPQKRVRYVPGVAFIRRAGDRADQALAAADQRAVQRIQEVLAGHVPAEDLPNQGTAT